MIAESVCFVYNCVHFIAANLLFTMNNAEQKGRGGGVIGSCNVTRGKVMVLIFKWRGCMYLEVFGGGQVTKVILNWACVSGEVPRVCLNLHVSTFTSFRRI